MSLRGVSYVVAIIGALLSCAYSLVNLRHDCGPRSLVQCVVQAIGFGGAGSDRGGGRHRW